MVRTKVEIKRIEDKSKRHTTFTKRRQGLFNKVNELCKRCNAEAAAITFSLAGNAYAFGYPCVESVLKRYDDHIQKHSHGAGGESEDNLSGVATTLSSSSAASISSSDSSLNVDELGMEELEDIRMSMDELKKRIIDRMNEISETIPL
ncbi:unnamed protein product [Cuscuta epithymum]|uniref:MADS-box domain-containing protein n=1 Tax=Cuscuta epithymum TaxID=186058 RepID=A0AAV0D930_9ASTE|nr:unnamed protein product [Cuscuta epithymum]